MSFHHKSIYSKRRIDVNIIWQQLLVYENQLFIKTGLEYERGTQICKHINENLPVKHNNIYFWSNLDFLTNSQLTPCIQSLRCCTVHAYVVDCRSFFIVCGLSMRKWVWARFLFGCICIAVSDPFIKRRIVGISLISVTRHIQRLAFHRQRSWFLFVFVCFCFWVFLFFYFVCVRVFNGLRREEVVGFVDIDGIVDHHCLNTFFSLYIVSD